jgi:predicted lipid carrier protein YhbT
MVSSKIVTTPGWVSGLIRLLPISLLDFTLVRVINEMISAHPELRDRLGEHANSIFLIDPTDLPILFRVQPAAQTPVKSLRRYAPGKWDVRIKASLAAFLSMLHGELDGDALFFSRSLTVEGDTEALLAFRNAIDAAEIDLASDFSKLFGPLQPVVERSVRKILPVIEHLTGLSLTGLENQAR